MTRVALISYLTTREKTLIFLVKKEAEAPLIFEAKMADGSFVTQAYLLKCDRRAIVDFHGLPPNWDLDPIAKEEFQQVLALPPKVNATKRTKEIRNDNLQEPQISRFAYHLDYWESLSEALLPAALRVEIAACELLCFVPHGPLHSLPFAALRWSANEYLIEKFGVCSVNSASVLKYCQLRNRRRSQGDNYRPQSCFVAAVAAEDDEDPQDFEADGAELEKLFSKGGRDTRLTNLVGAIEKENTQPASKSLIQQMISGHDVIHLACHGVFGVELNIGNQQAGGNPLDSGLLVSDGATSISLQSITAHNATTSPISNETLVNHLLSAREIFDLKLTADLVTLRACSSGRSIVEQGDELMGLTRAFLYAGTPSLLVSLWNVHKRSSQLLLNEFYRLWLDPDRSIPKWQALQFAQQKLMRGELTDNGKKYSHPYHWSPFILVGDWL
jgi:CHAT domain-containing protein